jgi:serine/threonine-protein kinase
MGVVYAAHDALLARDVAVKVITPQGVDRAVRERFLREARIVARLDHANVVPVYDLGEHKDCLFFVMPIIEGSTLRDLLARQTLTLFDALTIVRQVSAALAPTCMDCR